MPGFFQLCVKKIYSILIIFCNLPATLSFHITFITENKSGVLLEAQSANLKNIAKSQTFQIYHHSLNSALFAAKPYFFPICFNWSNHSSTVISKFNTEIYSSIKFFITFISKSPNQLIFSSSDFARNSPFFTNFSRSESKKNLSCVSISLKV